MGDLRNKLQTMRGTPLGWSDVGNLPEIPDTLREPLKELLQAMRELKRFALEAVNASPEVQKMAADREQARRLAVTDATSALGPPSSTSSGTKPRGGKRGLRVTRINTRSSPSSGRPGRPRRLWGNSKPGASRVVMKPG